MPEKTNEISELLRNADKFIKANKLEEALRLINKVFMLDQRNVYARAYKERITYLMSSQENSSKPVEQGVPEHKLAVPAQKPEAAPKQETQVQQKEGDIPAQFQQKITPPQRTQTEKNISEARKSDEHSQSSSASIKRSAAMLDAYRALLSEIWKDGKIDTAEQQRVESMRETLAITPQEHSQIENEIRIASYLSAIKTEWQKGVTNFDALRSKYAISEAEQISIEPKVFQLVQSLQANGSVLVLDDDGPFLKFIKEILTDAGYYCFTCITGEEGLQVLETMTPDIILCDVNFSKPNMSGFAFYEKFRSMEKFIITPFIFLSGLDQDVLIRTGKKLGADDYLTKPVDTELLIATIEGKLRRSRELRRILNH